MASLDPGATTFGEMTDEVIANLQGYVRDQESATHLLTTINTTDLSVAVFDASRGSLGVFEIEDELFWAQSADRTSNTLTVAPYGRGYQGSTAASHTSGARVTFGPRFPRHRVKRAINQTVVSMSKELPAVSTVEFDYNATVYSYEMPAAAKTVVDIRWQTVGPSMSWEPVTHWELELLANTTSFPSGVALNLGEALFPGQPVRTTYFRNPTPFAASTDLFTSTGYESQVYDVVVLGAMARLISGVDAARLDYKSMGADQLDTPTPMGSAATLSKFFWQLHLQRLDDERRRLLEQYQPRIRRAM